jgi:tetratricopeptide (TPR) repeat protein
MLKKLWHELSRSRRGAEPRAPDRPADAVHGAVARGDADEAARALSGLQPADPDFPRAASRVGDLLLARGERARALDHYFLALRANPLFRDARMGLSLGYYEAGDLEESLLQLRNVLQLRPDDPEALIQQGVIHLRWGNLEYAEQSLDEGLAVDPHHPQGWNNLGIVRQRQGVAAAALACFQRAVAIKADFATAHANLGLALREAERLDEARAHLERAAELRPASADAHVNLGTLLVDLGDLDGAGRAYRRALELDPRHAEATHGLGLVAFRNLDIAGARARFAEALALRPDYAAARTSLGELELAQGEFATGWANYESRLDTSGAPRLALPWREWRGERVPEETLLVYWEQGLGDVILFASCLRDAAARVGRLVVDVPDALQPLFARSFPWAHVIAGRNRAGADWLAGCDPIHACAAIGSLMRHFRAERALFPAHAGYLTPDPARVEAWRHRLDTLGPGRKLGLSWRGGLMRTGRLQRSLSAAAFAPLLAIEGTRWVSLQYGDCAADLGGFERATGRALDHWPESIADFDELAALMAALDGVVTVCNTTAHLAGALGVKGLVLAPRAVSWRYQLEGATLPWYPSLTVLRQRAPGDWTAVLDAAEAAIRAGAPGGGRA